MSECEHSSRLGAYHDDELDAASRAAVELHLSRCAVCAAELARLRRLSAELRGMATPAMPPQVLMRVHGRIDVLPSLAIGRLAAALTAVAAMILVTCGVLLWRSSSPAGRAGLMPVWEAAALERSLDPTAAGSEGQLAVWMFEDLSRENGHDEN